jgi:hypothetical protein
MWIYHQFINFLVALNHEKGDSSSLKQPSEAHCIEFLSQPIAVGLAIAEGVPMNQDYRHIPRGSQDVTISTKGLANFANAVTWV